MIAKYFVLFLRFVTSDLDEESHQELGVFHAARSLRDSGLLFQHDEEILQQIRDWFNDNLNKPARFTDAKPPHYRKRKNGIRGSKLRQKTISTRYGRLSPYLRITTFPSA